MGGLLWRTMSRSIDASKQRIKNSSFVTRIPFIRYSYLFEYPKGIVVPEMKLAFVPVQKVANRSMKVAIATRAGMQWPGDIHHAPWQYTPLALLRKNDYYRFGFVRNPLDRLLSCYAQKIVYYERELGMPPLFWRYGKTFHKDMTFEEFVEAVSRIPDRMSDVHFRSQHVSLYYHGKQMVDFVGHFERLEQDWEYLRKKFNLPQLPHQNRSHHVDYREAYTPEIAAVAAKRYKKDIELFGYSDEIEKLL